MTVSSMTFDPFFLAICCVAGACFYYWHVAGVNPYDHPDEPNAGRIFKDRLLGLVILGVAPACVVMALSRWTLADLGLKFSMTLQGAYWILLASIPIVVLGYFNAKNPANLALNPRIRDRRWTWKVFLMEYGGWAIYLLGYEFLFRGVLLFGSLTVLDVPTAIALNTVIYAFAHLTGGLKEALGAVVFGVVLCLVTVGTGNILSAYLIHFILSCSISLFSVRAHKDMKIQLI